MSFKVFDIFIMQIVHIKTKQNLRGILLTSALQWTNKLMLDNQKKIIML